MDFEKIKHDIFELYDECLERKEPFFRRLDLFIVPENLAARVLAATGIDISEHWVCMDNYGIVHALIQHGNPVTELKRGQISLKKEDFVQLIDVFLNPDEILAVGKTNQTNRPIIQFTKILEEKMFVVKEIRTTESAKKNKVSRIVFHTMYKKKATK
jgi:phage-Barnase-EndoU-ColicinE5/D-RelE like nuclease3